MGCLFLSSSLPEKQERISSLPWKRIGCSQCQKHPCQLLGLGKGSGQAWDGAFWESQYGKNLDWAIPWRYPHGRRAGHPQTAMELLSPTPSRVLEQPQLRQEQETRTNPSFCPSGEGWRLSGVLKPIVSHDWHGNIQSWIHPANPVGSHTDLPSLGIGLPHI